MRSDGLLILLLPAQMFQQRRKQARYLDACTEGADFSPKRDLSCFRLNRKGPIDKPLWSVKVRSKLTLNVELIKETSVAD